MYVDLLGWPWTRGAFGWVEPTSRALLCDSMPKMKTHHWAGVTLSLKYCFGCLPGRVYGWPKNVLHWVGIQNSILEIAAAVRPLLRDRRRHRGDGGRRSDPWRGGRCGDGRFGDDPVATDTVASTLMGFDPERIDYLAEAGRFLGQVDRARIDDTGEPPDAIARDFERAPTSSTEGRSG